MIELAPRYQHILDTCEPFLISYRGNWPSLNLAPFGFPIAPEHLFCPTSLKSRHAVDALHRLDSFSFGPQEMLMPRWVLFDCGEFPGIVFGFGRYARDLPADARAAYQMEGADRDDVFVPLSMWVAIPNAAPGAWFGHNLSSANLIMKSEPLPGLGTLSKAFGIAVAGIRHQYGATQWDSSSIHVHLTFGDLRLLSAYTPAHTHDETLSYLIEVDDERMRACLGPDWKRPAITPEQTFQSDDSAFIRDLHDRIEAGERWRLVATARQAGAPQLVHLARGF